MRNNRGFSRFLALLAVLAASLLLSAPQPADAQTPAEESEVDAPVGSAFTYQGRLTDNGNPANGQYNFQFILYNAATGGSQQGETLTKNGVQVSSGLFNVQLDFGQEVFNGDARFLEVGVKPIGATGAYTVLSPRTKLTATPYALGMPGVTLKDGRFTVPGWLQADHFAMTGTDFRMLPNARGNGGLALVHDANNTLVLNFGGEFTGGTRVDGWLQADHFAMAGTDFRMLPNARGNGGLALVHDANNTLVLNFGGEFTGGTRVDSALQVNGDVRVTNGSFIDDGTALNVPDYVFEPGYTLMSLGELGAYVATEQHLPGVPSQAEIHQDGLNLSQFHMRLLEKVEELTLYTLDQQAQIDAQQEQIATLQTGLAELEARLAALENH